MMERDRRDGTRQTTHDEMRIMTTPNFILYYEHDIFEIKITKFDILKKKKNNIVSTNKVKFRVIKAVPDFT